MHGHNLIDLLTGDEEQKELVESAKILNTLSRIPTFYREEPDLWFIQVEAMFSSCRIANNKTKFQLIIAQLDLAALNQVADLARDPPATEPYERLKERLLSIFGPSDHSRITKLLEEQRLGDQRPSQFLREMQLLAEGKVPADTLNTLWLRGLPQGMQANLATRDHTDSTKLAHIADKIA
ncbi:uncharacterized protein [Halyomorpha halys]|uniref:uncharacterized protein n=1 Tax=Halyomorpha halys TaxID=286706 RepID=UPI0006D4F46C|nr:uncharacterized protein LOC106689422 [Halyomorpha halys]